MINTIYYIFLLYFVECLLDHGLVALAGQAHELLGPELPEVGLHLAKHIFYWIVLALVWNIENVPESVAGHRLLGPVRLVCLSLIHI